MHEDAETIAPARGLTRAEAEARLARAGPNRLEGGGGPSLWRLLLGQFLSPMIGLLAAACAVAAALGEVADAAAIATIVALNGLMGFFQEYRAERALAALGSLTAPRARVLRDGHLEVIPAAEVVPGDLLSLEAGDLVAADARVVECHGLTTAEAALTGESAPVTKSSDPAAADAPLAERVDRVFMGTSVVDGAGAAEVVATGMKTEFGKIAGLLASARDEATPLQRRLVGVTRSLIAICGGVVVVIAGVGLARGLPGAEVLLTAVSLAVAAIPEGLPAVVTIALSVGVQRMAARKVLIRRLHAAETLGCATVICTDKTGTLTTGVMTLRELWTAEGADERRLVDAAAACCDAELGEEDHPSVGDPTELAILRGAAERGILRATIEGERPRRDERPFDAERKRMSILRADGVLYVKGAIESLLPRCVAGTAGAEAAGDALSERGLRVLAVAIGGGEEEDALTLLGLLGIADPPREEATRAVASARSAGVRTVMITGDHPRTARAIARELGILGEGDEPAGLVHARATPEDKLAIVRAWKERGAIVAMTGDGVNDAPALREAHVGVAMGKTGTEVTREAADVILTEDNFADIVAGVREGRGIFDNIRKSLVYLLSGNTGELVVMLVAGVVGLPLPLLPIQILWVNLVTDGLPALALVMDPADPAVMDAPPRSPDEPILGRVEWRRVALQGLLDASVVLGAFAWMVAADDLPRARALAFAVLVFCQVFRAASARSTTKTFWEVGVATNLRLVAVVVVTVAVQLVVLHVPAIAGFFGLGALGIEGTALALGLGIVPVTVIEVSKRLARLRH
ncbi:MAG: cation-translocating P-type ATPase [Nannocystaceae bacterium]